MSADTPDGSASKSYDPIPETVAEAVKRWDQGDTVFSVSMGGIGPGYEMAIQGLAFEFMREFDGKIPPHDVEMSQEEIDRANKDADVVVGKFDGEPWGGFSGAQVGAAKHLASIVIRRGYRAALRDDEVKDRLIQVCKLDLRSKCG